MSTHQQTKPRLANQSITEESARPGTIRSNVGCEAIDEPWTKRTAGFPSGVPTNFSQRKRGTSASSVVFVVQCSTPVMPASVIAARSFIASLLSFLPLDRCQARSIDLRARLAYDFRPALLLLAEEHAEFRGRRPYDLDPGRAQSVLHLRYGERRDHFALDPVDDRRGR